jgi:molybdenum cofactor biosynthesis protein B
MSKADSFFISLQIAVITISGNRTFENDNTGNLLQQLLMEHRHQLYHRQIVPHQLHQIRACVATLIADPKCQVILLNGGTGFAKDNCTEKAISPMFDQPVAGFAELFRQLSFAAIGSAALQSRATAGLANHTLIVAMPGSPSAAELAMVQLILPQLDARQQPCNFVSQLVQTPCTSKDAHAHRLETAASQETSDCQTTTAWETTDD